MLSDAYDYFLEDLRQYRASSLASLPYGYADGDPYDCPELQRFLTRHVFPFVSSDKVACEIGSGGGRMTQYLAGFKKVFAVDYWQEMHDDREKHRPMKNVVPVVTEGINLPGVPLLDFVLSFDTFTYCTPDELSLYLKAIAGYLRPRASVVFDYYRHGAKKIDSRGVRYKFDELDELVQQAGYQILTYDSSTFKKKDVVELYCN